MLIGNYEHSRSNKENLQLPIQMKLSTTKKDILRYSFFIFRILMKFPMV